jgi:hypothetical protein
MADKLQFFTGTMFDDKNIVPTIKPTGIQYTVPVPVLSLLFNTDQHQKLITINMKIRDAPDIRPDNPAFFISGIRPNIR